MVYLKLHLGYPAFIRSPAFNRENTVVTCAVLKMISVLQISQAVVVLRTQFKCGEEDEGNTIYETTFQRI